MIIIMFLLKTLQSLCLPKMNNHKITAFHSGHFHNRSLITNVYFPHGTIKFTSDPSATGTRSFYYSVNDKFSVCTCVRVRAPTYQQPVVFQGVCAPGGVANISRRCNLTGPSFSEGHFSRLRALNPSQRQSPRLPWQQEHKNNVKALFIYYELLKG